MRPVTKWNTVLNRAEDLPRIFLAPRSNRSPPAGPAPRISPCPSTCKTVRLINPKSGAMRALAVIRPNASRPIVDSSSAPPPCCTTRPARFSSARGATPSEAEGELVELAERLSVPVATTISEGSIGEDHPLAERFLGVVGSNGGTPETRALVDQADVVFFIGCRAGSEKPPSAARICAGKNKIIHCDVYLAVPGANYPVAVSLVGDAKLGLRMMNEALASTHRPLDGSRVEFAKEEKFAKFQRSPSPPSGRSNRSAWLRSLDALSMPMP